MSTPTPPAGYMTPLGRGKVIRLTRVDACGMPVGGAGNTFVSNAFVSVGESPNWDNGNDIKVTQADDSVGVYEPGVPTLLDYDIKIVFSQMNTGVIPMMSGDATVVDYAGSPVGWEEESLAARVNGNFAIEIWTGVLNQPCTAGSVPYGYLVIPHIRHVTFTLDDVTNKEIQGTIAGKTANHTWGKGPYTVVAGDSSNTPSRLLVPMSPTAHRHFQRTTIAPPPAVTQPGTLTLPTPY